MPDRIPLFPLEAVLFPGATLPLHIFESRYREMIRLCLGEEREFGVALQRPQGIAAVGCTALVTELLKEYEDGRLDILTEGQRRFHVERVLDEKAYYEAEVTYLEESRLARPLASLEGLMSAYEAIHWLLFDQHAPPLEENLPSVAWAILGELPLDLEFKQLLLETDPEQARCDALRQRLEAWIPQVEHQKRVKRAAGGNGHGLLKA
jgi:Lon protease-like protein